MKECHNVSHVPEYRYHLHIKNQCFPKQAISPKFFLQELLKKIPNNQYEINTDINKEFPECFHINIKGSDFENFK